MYVCCGVGCVKLSRCMWMRTARRVAVAWLVGFEWMRTARCVAVAWLRGFEWMRWCWGGRRGVFVVAWLRIFFIFCLRRGGGYMYS